ncbi:MULTISPECIES: peptide deformylase [Staphylococcus]|nr:peptide deformylase [Staphylococcus shinii]
MIYLNTKLYKSNYIINMKDIVKEDNEMLYKKTKPLEMPLSDSDFTLLNNMMLFLKNSQNEQKSKKYNLRPGVGLSANQLGLDKKMCVIYLVDEHGIEHENFFINPKIIRESVHKIYLLQGEGCLSVDRPIYGIVPRNERITVKYKNLYGEEKILKLKGHASIVAQHEIDHLNGVMFFEHIDKVSPLSPPNNATSIY